jgi:hypothetical protein
MEFAPSVGRILPAALARAFKRVAVQARYRRAARRCREGFERLGASYPQSILFAAALPKSGSTWLARMLAAFPGFSRLLIPDVAAHELRTGGSHDYELPEDAFRRMRGMLVVTKMHIPASPHNISLLRQHDLRHVVLYRDLRDVAVSYTHYVRQTPWHPHYPHYRRLSITQGLERFARELLPAYVAWVDQWHAQADGKRTLIVRYETLLTETEGVMRQIALHFGLEDAEDSLAGIVARHSFERLRARHGARFYRKGVAGDWRHHFTPALVDMYKESAGDFLVTYGYEADAAW